MRTRAADRLLLGARDCGAWGAGERASAARCAPAGCRRRV